MKKSLLLGIIFSITNLIYTQVPNYVPTNGLVGWWPFTGNANDLSGNGYNGSFVNQLNGLSFVSDRFNNSSNAIQFNSIGINNQALCPYVNVTNSSNINFNQEYSFNLWSKIGQNTQAAELINRGPDNNSFFSRFNGLYGFAFGNLPAYFNNYPSWIVDTTQWHMYTCVRNSAGNGLLYCDGILIGSQNISSIVNNNSNFAFGLMPSGGTNGSYYPYQGMLDDIGIWNRALSNCEIQALYQGSQLTSAITPQSNTTFCQGGSVNLIASQGSTYLWSNGQTTQSISATTSGSYTVQVTDANGCVRTSAPTVVTVNPNPQVTITGSGPTTFCSGDSVTITSTGGSSYQWSNNQSGDSISVNTSGMFYTIGTDANGCLDTSNTISVVVNPNPQVNISNNGSTTFCQGSSVTLTSMGASTYQWSNNQSGDSISVNTSGSLYTIGTDANGCIDTSNIISVVVNPNPQVSISNNGSTTFCQGGSVTLTSTGASSYQWSNNQSGNSISVNTSGSFYTIGTDANGCIDTSNTISVVVNPNPTAVITPSGLTSFCLGDSVLLNGVQGLNNTWSNGQTGTSIWVFQSGVYQLQVMDGNGCQDSSSVQINVFPLPQLSISLQGDDAFCQGDSTILIGSGSITYLWSTGDITSSIQVNSSGLYSFMGTDVNGCTSSSNQIPISVIDYPVVLTQPQDIQEQVGNNVVFSIGTQNTSNSFQWEGDLGLGFQTINNGGQYGGATTNQLTVSNITQNNNGQLFRCVVTNDICSVVSDTAILTIKPNSGILDFSGGFTLNPNPTQNNLTIQFQDPVNSNYSLLDFTGKELRIGKMEGKELTISVQTLPVGVYFIRIDGKQIRFIRN